MTCNRSKLRIVGPVILPTGPTVTMANLLVILGVTRETLRVWRQSDFPAGFKQGRDKWFITAHVQNFLEANCVECK